MAKRGKLIVWLWLLWTLAVVISYYPKLWQCLAFWFTTARSPENTVVPLKEFLKGTVFLFFNLLFFYCACVVSKYYIKKDNQLLLKRNLALFVFFTFLAIFIFVGMQKLPYFREAMSRGVIAMAGAGSVLLAAHFLGWEIFQLLKWRFDHWRERLIFQISTGLIILSNFCLVLAALGTYSTFMIRVVITVILLLGIMLYYRRFLFTSRLKAFAGKISWFDYNKSQSVWIVITILAVSMAFIPALAPETEFDALSYHLTFPQAWLQKGYLADLPERYVSLYPMSWGLVFGMGLSMGGTVGAKLLHFACLPLTCMLIYQFIKRFLPTTSAWLAVVVFVTVPTVLWEASTAYIDLAMAMHTGIVLYCLCCYIGSKQWKWILLAAVNLGMALASKHLALFVLALATVGLLFCLWMQERRWRRIIKPVITLAAIALLLPMPWYIRSYLATGNPIFPEFYSIFGAPADRWNPTTQRGLHAFLMRFGRPRTLINELTLPWDMTIHAFRYGGSIGPVFLIMLAPLTGVFVKRITNTVLAFLFVFVIGYFILWASPLSSFQIRFILPVLPALSILTAESCCLLKQRLNLPLKAGRTILLVFSCILILNLPPFIAFHEVDRENWKGRLTHVLRGMPFGVVLGNKSQEAYLSHVLPSYNAWRFINATVEDTARILSFSDGDHYYSNRERIWSQATIASRAVWGAPAGQEAQAYNWLHHLNISYILVDKQMVRSQPPGTLAIMSPAFMPLYNWKYEDEHFALGKLK